MAWSENYTQLTKLSLIRPIKGAKLLVKYHDTFQTFHVEQATETLLAYPSRGALEEKSEQ